MAALFFWVVLSGASKGKSSWTGYTTAQRLACLMPQSLKEIIVLALASGFLIFGLVCVWLGAWWIVGYWLRRLGLGRR